MLMLKIFFLRIVVFENFAIAFKNAKNKPRKALLIASVSENSYFSCFNRIYMFYSSGVFNLSHRKVQKINLPNFWVIRYVNI